LRACSRSPGANFDAQPALVEYFVSLMRVRSSIIHKYTRGYPRELESRVVGSEEPLAFKRRWGTGELSAKEPFRTRQRAGVSERLLLRALGVDEAEIYGLDGGLGTVGDPEFGDLGARDVS
jgi:hypothetical protein